MDDIRRSRETEFTWVQPGTWKQEFELRSGDKVFATVKWKGAFSASASAEIDSGRWDLKRSGFWHVEVSIRSQNSDIDEAVFHEHFNGSGTVDFISGTRYEWKGRGFFQRTWSFYDMNGLEVMSFKPMMKMKIEIPVEIKDKREESPLLAVLGLFILVNKRRSHAAAGVPPIVG